MNTKNIWDNYYKKTPLKQIPWNYTKADYFLKLLDSNKLGIGKALDLGCGVGRLSMALSKKGFDVTGIDISQTAIAHAKQNAKKENEKIKFYAKDATNLSFLKDETFDFVLDWANLHGVPEDKRIKYINEIIKHTKKRSRLVLRCFSKYNVSKMELGFLTPMGIIYLFSKEDIIKLYGKYFKIIDTNRSKPRNHPYRWFDEYLMERK